MGFMSKIGNVVSLDTKTASSAAVHLSLILGVIVYTLFGALTMQFLESPDASVRVRRQAIDESPKRLTQVYLGTEIADMDKGVHACLKHVLSGIFNRTACREHDIEHLNIFSIDSCYQFARFDGIQATQAYATEATQASQTITAEEQMELEIEEELDKWSFGNSLIFTFTVITTIGYGHVAPETFYGRLFCIIYGVFGVPLTLLTIADMGMFLTYLLRSLLKLFSWIQDRIHSLKKSKNKQKISKSADKFSSAHDVLSTARELTAKTNDDDINEVEEEENDEKAEKDVSEKKTDESILLAITFALYLIMGAKVLSVYEPEMDFFKAFYFNFVTLTTIGLGDFVPKSYDYLFVTLVYIGVGLSLTTMAIEIAADVLKKVHYVGRKMENMASTVVWFGGKKMTMKNLVKYLGDQFNIDEKELENFNLDEFVDNAIKVEAGEIKTLRKPADPVVFRERPVSYSNLRKSAESSSLFFMDDRHSKTTAELSIIPEDTFRTMDMLRVWESSSENTSRSTIPKLDLENQMFSDSSVPNSFDEDYLKTLSRDQ